MCPPFYHHNGFMAPLAFGQKIYSHVGGTNKLNCPQQAKYGALCN